eukprot:45926-Hanusia_phi.AAC.1
MSRSAPLSPPHLVLELVQHDRTQHLLTPQLLISPTLRAKPCMSPRTPPSAQLPASLPEAFLAPPQRQAAVHQGT